MDPSLSRRSVLAGLGVATGVAAVGATAVGAALPAGAAEPDSSSTFPWPAPTPAAALVAGFTPAAGLDYLVLDPTTFDGLTGVRTVSGVGTTTTVGDSLFAPINLPIGSTLHEVVLQYIAPTAPAPIGGIYKCTPGVGYQPLAQTTLSTGAGGLETTLAVHEEIDGSASYMTYLSVQVNTQRVQGARIGYTPPPAGFIATTPVPRVLDTRNDPAGKLKANEERVIQLGTVGASAAVINLTVTETEGGGFVAVFAADTGWPGNSSINWSSTGQNLANGVITDVDPGGRIKIRGGANSTHVVIDVQGYMV